MNRLHLTDHQIAALADDVMPAAERTLLEEHLRTCRSCYDAYSDTLRYSVIWQTDPSIVRADPSVAAIAHETPLRTGRSPRHEMRPRRLDDPSHGPWSLPVTPRPRSRGRGWFAARRWAPVLAGFAVMIAAVAVLWHPLRRSAAPDQAVWSPVRKAVEQASVGGAIVIPGTEAVAATVSPAIRSGHAEPTTAVRHALAELSRTYRNHQTAPEVAQWLISGYLAVGQLENARIYAEDARRRYPGNTRFDVLSAIVAYRSNNMARAQRLLQLALHTNPRDGAALLNLGLVQYEQGHWDSARRTFESVQQEYAGRPLGQRAGVLIDGLLGEGTGSAGPQNTTLGG